MYAGTFVIKFTYLKKLEEKEMWGRGNNPCSKKLIYRLTRRFSDG
jgi:hypothetical protein